MSFLVFALTLLVMTLMGCSNSHPVKPDADNVKISRESADEDCIEIGPVEGRTLSTSGTLDEALNDLKKDAAFKGANYVQMEQTGAHGQAVRGTAYLCQ